MLLSGGWTLSSPGIMSSPVRILVLEDSEADALLAVHEIEKTGLAFEWRRVETEESFRSALDSFKPTLVLADYTLPQFDGRTALLLTRSLRPELPFIFVTGTLGEELAIDLLKEGATDYVLKSRLGRLGPAVQRALREQNELQQRRKVEQAHLDALERYRQVVENTTEIVYSVDMEGFFTYSNRAGLKLSGYSMGELWRLRYLDLVMPEHRDRVRAHYMRQYLSKQPTSLIEFPFRTKHHTARWLAASAAFVMENGEYRGFHVIARDITEQKAIQEEILRTNEQLRALAARLESVREDEQTRIAREIHDELGQALTGLKMDLVWMEKKLREFPSDAGHVLREKLTAMESLIDETVQAVRRISAELRPSVLDDLGLVAAIEWQLEQFAERTAIKYSLDAGEMEIDRPHATAVFRIFQEALTNIARHSSATRVWVKAKREDETFLLEVKDNGRGITEEEIGKYTSIGLLGMKERALMVGGSVDIRGKAGKGTTVTVRVPLEGKDSHV